MAPIQVLARIPKSREKQNMASPKALKDFFAWKHHYEIDADSLNISAPAQGILVGGNLSLLVSLLGSKYQINTDGKILFLEDVGEYTYSYDRMLYALPLQVTSTT